ncbi:phosphotransferase [Robertkochia sediminum]|uniref:phosphotransferase n=1 Tax=Robertkochia sediminum TaxID=2785326 RepID=UPI001932EE5F|nr:phosphotransferase [Robertkochia sediminum]MBL7473739.1 phosphotransferase [Robertkochia sediminum]
MKYLKLINAEGKEWFMPEKGCATGLQLYQPSSFKGQLLKKYLPYVKGLHVVLERFHIEKQEYTIPQDFQDICHQVFDAEVLEYAFFNGTPSVHQKQVIQIFKENSILGYAKRSSVPGIKANFDLETRILNKLHSAGIHNVPQCLYLGTLSNEEQLFIQSTRKTKSSFTHHTLKPLHWDFLSTVKEKTGQVFECKESGLYNSLLKFQDLISGFQLKDFDILKERLRAVLKELESTKLPVSVYHRDFTPWNMFVEKGKLFVFDWEYAETAYPAYLDAFHFYTQTAMLVKKWSPEKVFKGYVKQRITFKKYIADPDRLYQYYLLDIMSLYLDREDRVLSAEEAIEIIAPWLQLFEFLSAYDGTK